MIRPSVNARTGHPAFCYWAGRPAIKPQRLHPRTSDDACKQIGSLLDPFTPQECANYLVNAGYAST
jgi:hypothetical protein